MIAYFILIHRYPEQFERLLKSIYSQNNYYLLHVDKRSGQDLYLKIQDMVKDYPNISLLESQKVIWGGYSMVDVELNAIKKLLEVNTQWEHYINLSGQDFPLQHQDVIQQYLVEHKGSSFLTFANQKTDRPNTLNRIRNYYVESANGFKGKPVRRAYLKDTVPYIGGQWKVLTRDCCDFITHNRNVSKYREYYRHTLIPDESFFQTVLMNMNYTGKLVNDHKRAIIWIPDIPIRSKGNKTKDTKSLIESGKIKLRPKTFTLKDKKFLFTNEALFARKFDQLVDEDIIFALEKKISQKTDMRISKNMSNDTGVPEIFLQGTLTR